ncbi:hypothetical protein [Planococcus dechangensis]|uniref:Uncharacterized protein n=1 Tax=Planococcus dechangensis TaxID=1176255 RepID=A0ABV9MDL2_9BACL
MTTIVKDQTTMESPAKTYLQTYEEYINGYKQYKLEKTTPQWHVPVESKVMKIQAQAQQ